MMILFNTIKSAKSSTTSAGTPRFLTITLCLALGCMLMGAEVGEARSRRNRRSKRDRSFKHNVPSHAVQDDIYRNTVTHHAYERYDDEKRWMKMQAKQRAEQRAKQRAEQRAKQRAGQVRAEQQRELEENVRIAYHASLQVIKEILRWFGKGRLNDRVFDAHVTQLRLDLGGMWEVVLGLVASLNNGIASRIEAADSEENHFEVFRMMEPSLSALHLDNPEKAYLLFGGHDDNTIPKAETYDDDNTIPKAGTYEEPAPFRNLMNEDDEVVSFNDILPDVQTPEDLHNIHIRAIDERSGNMVDVDIEAFTNAVTFIMEMRVLLERDEFNKSAFIKHIQDLRLSPGEMNAVIEGVGNYDFAYMLMRLKAGEYGKVLEILEPELKLLHWDIDDVRGNIPAHGDGLDIPESVIRNATDVQQETRGKALWKRLKKIVKVVGPWVVAGAVVVLLPPAIEAAAATIGLTGVASAAGGAAEWVAWTGEATQAIATCAMSHIVNGVKTIGVHVKSASGPTRRAFTKVTKHVGRDAKTVGQGTKKIGGFALKALGSAVINAPNSVVNAGSWIAKRVMSMGSRWRRPKMPDISSKTN